MSPPRPARQVIDEIDRRLAADQVIPVDLAAELMAAMPADERTRWLRTLARVAWRPDNLEG